METVLWREGKVEVEVPDPKKYPPSEKSPIFFNPRAKLSRDFSVLALKVLKPPQIVDAMCGTGIRGIRYAVESGIEEIVFNDINPRALELARKNAERYGINAEFLNEDVDLLFHRRRFVAIDLDPFGSPSPFLQSLSRSITHNGIVLVTATDTAPLAGASPNAAMRKYHAVVRRVPWYREFAVRVLLGYVQHHLMVFEKALRPVLSFFAEHHIRIIGRVIKKPSFVSSSAERIKLVDGLGPLWTGSLHERGILERMLNLWDKDYEREVKRFLEASLEEVETVGYYHLHFLARELKTSIPPVKKVIETLRDLGFRASRSAFEPRAVKTDAPREVVETVVKELSR